MLVDLTKCQKKIALFFWDSTQCRAFRMTNSFAWWTELFLSNLQCYWFTRTPLSIAQNVDTTMDSDFNPSLTAIRGSEQEKKLRGIFSNTNEHSLQECIKRPMGNSPERKHFSQNIYVFLSLALNRYNELVDIRIQL